MNSGTTPKRQPKRYDVPPGLILDPNQRYTIPESSAILRQSNSRTWLQISQGKLQTIKDGGRTYITGASLIRRSTPPDTGTQAA